MIAGIVGVLLGLFLTRVQTLQTALPAHEPDPVNGEMVFHTGGCVSCHAAPGAEGSDKLILAGGLEIKSEFGTFVVPNISPHPEAGIGNWGMIEFVNAMKFGTSPDGTHYYPAFPYASYTRMSLEDIMDLAAFMDTLPASDNIPPAHDVGFPFNIRRAVGGWNLLFFRPGPVTQPSDDPQIERGRYLVEGAGHCSECHTPRNGLGGLQMDRWMAGGPNPDGPGKIPNITPGGDLDDWSTEDIAYYLETGFTPDFDSVGGSMTSVVDNLSKISPQDRLAIAAYLKSLPALPTE